MKILKPNIEQNINHFDSLKYKKSIDQINPFSPVWFVDVQSSLIFK